MRLDLSDLAIVDAFVEEFTGKYDRCDGLMNNAGVMALPERSLTVNGLETQMGTNHMVRYDTSAGGRGGRAQSFAYVPKLKTQLTRTAYVE